MFCDIVHIIVKALASGQMDTHQPGPIPLPQFPVAVGKLQNYQRNLS